MKEVKWGIVGPGNIATQFIKDLEFITTSKNIPFAVVGRDLESSKRFCDEFNIPHYFDTIDLLLDENIVDCVYIATPHPLHYEHALAALQKGVPVLCEKPLAINKQEVLSLIEASRNNNAFLLEGMWISFLPSIKKIREIIQSNTIGRVNSLSASLTYKAPYEKENRYFNNELGGGSLMDLGIYPVTLAYLLLGVPDKILATAHIGETQVDESCAMIFKYKNGAYALLESSLLKQAPADAYIYGELGNIVVKGPWNEKPQSIQVQLYDGSVHEYKMEWEGHGLHFEAAEQVACLEKGILESSDFTHQNSLDVMDILDEVRGIIHLNYKNDEVQV